MRPARGLLAGALGALAVGLADRAESAILGGPPVYAPARMAARLARTLLHLHPAPRTARRAAIAMRAVYALALGVGCAAVPAPRPRGLRAAALGCAVALGELLVLPLVGATPPVRRWPAGEAPLLVAHALAFTSAAELALAASARPAPSPA